MDTLIASFQKHMVKAPLYGSYPAANIMVSYASDSFPGLVGPPWYLTSIVSAIHKGPHTLILTSEATTCVCNELQERVQRSFSIILSVDDALIYFGTRLCNSRLASVDQTNRKPRLVYNFSAVPDSTIPSINAYTDSSTNPYIIQFGACLPNLLHQIWEINLIDGPLYLSKWEIYDAFHRCNLCPADIGIFSYIIPLLYEDPHPLLYIYLVLPMGYVNSPDIFCFTPETIVDLAN